MALVLVVVAPSIVVLEPLPHGGPVLLTLTRDHGVDSGDLPAVARVPGAAAPR